MSNQNCDSNNLENDLGVVIKLPPKDVLAKRLSYVDKKIKFEGKGYLGAVFLKLADKETTAGEIVLLVNTQALKLINEDVDNVYDFLDRSKILESYAEDYLEAMIIDPELLDRAKYFYGWLGD